MVVAMLQCRARLLRARKAKSDCWRCAVKSDCAALISAPVSRHPKATYCSFEYML